MVSSRSAFPTPGAPSVNCRPLALELLAALCLAALAGTGIFRNSGAAPWLAADLYPLRC